MFQGVLTSAGICKVSKGAAINMAEPGRKDLSPHQMLWSRRLSHVQRSLSRYIRGKCQCSGKGGLARFWYKDLSPQLHKRNVSLLMKEWRLNHVQRSPEICKSVKVCGCAVVNVAEPGRYKGSVTSSGVGT
jgi:hypothetical protein